MTNKEKRNHYYVPITIEEDKRRLEFIIQKSCIEFGFKMTKPQAIKCALKHYAEHLNTMEKANDK